MNADEALLITGAAMLFVFLWVLLGKYPSTPGDTAWSHGNGRRYIAGHLCKVGYMPDFELNIHCIQVLDVSPQLFIRCQRDPSDDYRAAVQSAIDYHSLFTNQLSPVFYDYIKPLA